MARTDPVTLAAYGVLFYVGYRLAEQGKLGPEFQRAAADIHTALFGQPPASSAPSPSLVSTSSTASAANPCAFIPGVRYVAQTADGRYEVVVNGARQGIFPVLEQAENYYNQLVCSGPSPGQVPAQVNIPASAPTVNAPAPAVPTTANAPAPAVSLCDVPPLLRAFFAKAPWAAPCPPGGSSAAGPNAPTVSLPGYSPPSANVWPPIKAGGAPQTKSTLSAWEQILQLGVQLGNQLDQTLRNLLGPLGTKG